MACGGFLTVEAHAPRAEADRRLPGDAQAGRAPDAAASALSRRAGPRFNLHFYAVNKRGEFGSGVALSRASTPRTTARTAPCAIPLISIRGPPDAGDVRCSRFSRAARQVPEGSSRRQVATRSRADTSRITAGGVGTSYFPYLTGGRTMDRSARRGPPLAARATTKRAVTTNAAFDAERRDHAAGSRYALVKFARAATVGGLAVAGWSRGRTVGPLWLFRVGNETEKDDELVTGEDPFLYRVRRTRYRGNVEVTRQLRGPLSVAVRADVEDPSSPPFPGLRSSRATSVTS